MNRDARHIAIVAVLALLIALLGGVAGWCMRGENNRQQPPPVPDTTWFTLTDTVTLVEPRDSLTRIVWKPYPVHDTTFVIRHTTDSVFVMLPYEHRHLHRPDTLDVWYSGVDARIDSATVYYHHTTEIVNHIAEVSKMMPRLTAGVGCGAFYHEKQVFPFLVGEMRYNAPKTTWQVYGGINHEGQWAAGASATYQIHLIK